MSLFDFGSKVHVQCTNGERGIITVWFLLLSGFLLLESTKLLLQCYYYHVILYRIAICAFYGFSFGIVFTFWMNYYLIFVIFWLITIANHQITSVLYLYCTAKGLFLRFGFWDRCFSCLDEQCTFAKEKKNCLDVKNLTTIVSMNNVKNLTTCLQKEKDFRILLL